MPTLLSDETPSRKKNSFKLHQEAQRQQQNQFYKACTQVLQQKDTDEFEAIGINIAAKLKKMDSVQQLLAEGLINKILLRGLFNELTRSTDVMDSNWSDGQSQPPRSNSFNSIHATGNECSQYSSSSTSSTNFASLSDYYGNISTDLTNN
ncbi:uncharacterized protein CBL_03105 [Carabus blaptoides fortunei]